MAIFGKNGTKFIVFLIFLLLAVNAVFFYGSRFPVNTGIDVLDRLLDRSETQEPVIQPPKKAILPTVSTPTMPPQAAVKPKVIEISCGALFSLALKSNGTLWATGINNFGQLGVGEGITTNRWIQVLWNVKDAAAGYEHALAIKRDNTLWLTGRNNFGQLGLSNNDDVYIWSELMFSKKEPVFVSGNVAAGWGQSLLIQGNGSLWAAGLNARPDLARVKDNTSNEWRTILDDAKAAASGYYFTLAVKKAGSALWVRGNNYDGQFGKGEGNIATEWLRPMTHVVKVAAGLSHVLVIDQDGTLWAAGWNEHGQLGLGDRKTRTRWTKSLENVKEIACGWAHSLAVTEDGTLWVCGKNDFGQLGLGNNSDSPKWTKTLANVEKVSAGKYHSLALLKDGSVWGTGSDDQGQLGKGDNYGSVTWMEVFR